MELPNSIICSILLYTCCLSTLELKVGQVILCRITWRRPADIFLVKLVGPQMDAIDFIVYWCKRKIGACLAAIATAWINSGSDFAVLQGILINNIIRYDTWRFIFIKPNREVKTEMVNASLVIFNHIVPIGYTIQHDTHGPNREMN